MQHQFDDSREETCRERNLPMLPLGGPHRVARGYQGPHGILPNDISGLPNSWARGAYI
jgi:hypothetical protein